MKPVFPVICVSLVISLGFEIQSSFANEGQPIQDEKLFASIREHYKGTWENELDGPIHGEILKDGSVLIEPTDHLAKLLFNAMPQAQEEILYIPESREGGRTRWLNYFDRKSENAICGLSSMDLKEDPFTSFKCRMRIDALGGLHAFLDRSTETSNAKLNAGWETGQWDFHMASIVAITSNGYTSFKQSSEQEYSTTLQFGGKLAKAIYDSLKIEPFADNWGPYISVQVKKGKSIWCSMGQSQIDPTSPFFEEPYKCEIGFDLAGKTLQTYSR